MPDLQSVWKRLRRPVVHEAERFIPEGLTGHERTEYLRTAIIILGGILISLPYVPIYLAWDHPVSKLGILSVVFMVSSLGTALFWTRRGYLIVANCQIVLSSFGALLAVEILLGRDTNLHIYLTLVGCALILIHPKRARWLAVVYGVIGLILLMGMEGFAPETPLLGPPLPQALTSVFTLMGLGLTYAALFGFTWWHQINTERLTDALQKEKDRSEKLLLNIMPSSIAERLMASNDEIADGFENVTVLFADIVNFTEIAKELEPRETVKFLNQLFTAFDGLTHALELEKIKTIGDAYMVAGGIPKAREDHAEAVLQLAIAMIQHIEGMAYPNGKAINIRIGINSGPVVAGVIGLRRFIYDLWGDTVNMASRLESQGIENRIQISDSTYQFVKDKYRFEIRKEVNLKGVGTTNTYLLIRN